MLYHFAGHLFSGIVIFLWQMSRFSWDFITKSSFNEQLERLVGKLNAMINWYEASKECRVEAIQMKKMIGSLNWNDRNHKWTFICILYNCHVRTQALVDCAFYQVNIYSRQRNEKMKRNLRKLQQWNEWQTSISPSHLSKTMQTQLK